MKKTIILIICFSIKLYAIDLESPEYTRLDNLLYEPSIPYEDPIEGSNDTFEHYLQENISPFLPRNIRSFQYVHPLTQMKEDPFNTYPPEKEITEMIGELSQGNSILYLYLVRCVESHAVENIRLPCQIIQYGFSMESEEGFIIPIDIYFHNSPECPL